VCVWRKKDGWTGPFKLLLTNDQTYIVQMPYRLTQFQSTVVKPYYQDKNSQPKPISPDLPQQEQPSKPRDDINSPEKLSSPKKKYNSDTIVVEVPPQFKNGTRTQSHLTQSSDFDNQFITAILERKVLTIAFLSSKEKSD
jgi:hypothetical protein